MSKVGRKPVPIPPEVSVETKDNEVIVRGPKGAISLGLPRGISAEVLADAILIKRTHNDRLSLALHGTFRSLVSNMVDGVTRGYEKQLKLVGTGFRAEVSDNMLKLNVGYSHPVDVVIPEGIEISVEKNVLIKLAGIDKQKVGQFAAEIRKVRPPEPYKGKGIIYADEVVARKPGKAAKAVGVPGATA